MSDIENRLKRLENIVQDQREEISDLKATVSDLQVQLGKIQIRDLLSAFGQMFCRRVGGLYKDPVLVERQPGQESWQTVNFTKTSNMSLLLKELDEHKGRLPQNIQTALAELEELCGSDPVALARYCHEHQGDRSEWNAMAHLLLKYLASENRDNEQLRGEAETVIQNLTPVSKDVAQQVLKAVCESPTALGTNVANGSSRRRTPPPRTQSSTQPAKKQRRKQ